MITEPVHNYFGTPLSEWIAAVPVELDIDAVGLWQIVPALKASFGLSGEALDQAVRSTLQKILARGAKPVVGSQTRPGSWQVADKYGDAPDLVVDAVLSEWHEMGRDPDVGDVWFALPRVTK